MRMLISLLFLLMFSVCPVQAADVPTGTQDMLHLAVQATGVRLRAGAGTEFAIVGMASREKEMSRYFIAYATPRMDSEGRPWFRLLAKIERQEDTALFRLDRDCWIRSDFVKTRALNEKEAELADSLFFRILSFAPSLLPAVRPTEAIPAYSEEKLCFFPQDGDKADLMLPAGEEYLLFNLLKGQRACAGLWKAVDGEHIRFAGSVPAEAFADTDFGADQAKAEAWLKQKLAP
ncbi:hypothetical protein [Mailhella sp.]